VLALVKGYGWTILGVALAITALCLR